MTEKFFLHESSQVWYVLKYLKLVQMTDGNGKFGFLLLQKSERTRPSEE